MAEDELNEFRLSPELRQKLKDKDFIQKELIAGKSPQEIVGFSNETMAKFYGMAYRLFELRRYEDAGNAFLFLATLNPRIGDYWLGFGMATQMCHDYELAIDAYELVAIADLDNPAPYFYLAKCLFAIHDRDSALQALDLAIETAGDQEEYAGLKQQALAAKRILILD